ncbi:hypothetical protein CEXT_39881 [Caerostris extrusa]|uniref:Uncharacterized protein n=1 Tax=Caerostris extrusa TaxID=172846 RepID=A0AAV4SRV7_CAEEX|nr:hypothetical protein CEXT_39881 [Caerostris extrusa]
MRVDSMLIIWTDHCRYHKEWIGPWFCANDHTGDPRLLPNLQEVRSLQEGASISQWSMSEGISSGPEVDELGCLRPFFYFFNLKILIAAQNVALKSNGLVPQLSYVE